MQIYGASHVHGPQPTNTPHAQPSARTAGTSSAAPAGDQLEISAAGKLAAQIGEIPDIRADRVADIRQAIAQGSYETPQRIEGAVSRLLDEIG